MISMHPSDIEIQDYMSGDHFDTVVAEHIFHCEACSLKSAQYASVVTGIKQQSDPLFTFDLTKLVMEQLPAKKGKPFFDKYFIYLISGVLIFSLPIMIYPLKKYFPNWKTCLTPIMISLIAAAALIISILAFFDMYRNFREKMNVLNFG